jgi:hypothetical protein
VCQPESEPLLQRVRHQRTTPEQVLSVEQVTVLPAGS